MIVVNAGAPTIRTPSRLGKRKDQFDFLKPKFDAQWTQVETKPLEKEEKKNYYTTKNFPLIVVMKERKEF